jgi:hypothetical protein
MHPLLSDPFPSDIRTSCQLVRAPLLKLGRSLSLGGPLEDMRSIYFHTLAYNCVDFPNSFGFEAKDKESEYHQDFHWPHCCKTESRCQLSWQTCGSSFPIPLIWIFPAFSF